MNDRTLETDGGSGKAAERIPGKLKLNCDIEVTRADNAKHAL